MSTPSPKTLQQQKCVPCEGGVPAIAGDALAPYLAAIPQWQLDDSGKLIYRKFSCRNFVQAIELINQVAQLAEQEQHHPDLHLTGYRKVRIELTTHAIGGLSENDFIVAAKIDSLVADHGQ